MKYIDVYHFNVIRELENGNTVYVLDKANEEVTKAATMRAIDLVRVLKEAEEPGNNRFCFWKKEEEKGGAK